MLYRALGEWQMWTADLLESHVSYPMLALFRSQHPGQSWVTALGVVTDAATLDRRPAWRGPRAASRTSCTAGGAGPSWRSRADSTSRRRARRPTWLVEENFELAWRQLVEARAPAAGQGEAWADLQALRATYGDQLERLIDFLVAPRGFWGHSAEETVADEVALAASEARRKARRPVGLHGAPPRSRYAPG